MNTLNLLTQTIELINILTIIIPTLLAVALLTLLERKILGYIQLRKGPNLVGPLGILQPITDGLKLFIKENFKPSTANQFMFFVSPPLFFLISLSLWSVITLPNSGLNLNLSILFILAISSLSVYSLLIAGWSSNSKYALLGSIRGIAQLISYEVSLGLIILPIIFIIGGWNLNLTNNINTWLIIPCTPLFIMWFISTLAETNRSPFDLAEGESELVSGYNIEYAGAPFVLFFIGEYANIIFMNLLSAIIFLNTNIFPNNIILNGVDISTKTSILIIIFLWIRASFPRIRYDQLMMLMWKNFLPLTISLVLLYYCIITLLNGIPSYYN